MKSKCNINIFGTKVWKNYKREYHREDGPAVIFAHGVKEWYQNNQLHRIGGPAIEHPSGYKEWHKYGRLYVETIL